MSRNPEAMQPKFTMYIGLCGMSMYAAACGGSWSGGKDSLPPNPTENAVLPVQVVPSEGIHAGGPVGGPFDPVTETVTISNPGTGDLPWSVSSDASWLNFSVTSSTVLPDGTAQIQVTVDSAAGDFTPGDYRGTITFKNTVTDAVVAQLPTSLGVGVTIEEKSWFSVHGEPFFPIGAWAPPASANHVAYLKSLGINTYLTNGSRPPSESNSELLGYLEDNDMWAVLGFDPAVMDHPRLLAWLLRDEPGVKKIPVSEVQEEYDAIKAADPHHLVGVNLSAYAYWDTNFGSYYYEDLFRDFTAIPDFVSVDMYPATGWNQPEWVYILGQMTRFVRQRYVYEEKPVWTIVESSRQRLSWTPDDTPGPTPAQMKFEVWDSIINGATAVHYFTIAFNPFEWSNLTPEIEQEMVSVNANIQDLSQVILSVAPSINVTSWEANGKKHDFTVRQNETTFYVFAANADMAYEPASISFMFDYDIESISVYDEGRDITPNGKWFTDDFPPLGVHIYEVRLVGMEEPTRPGSLFPNARGESQTGAGSNQPGFAGTSRRE